MANVFCLLLLHQSTFCYYLGIACIIQKSEVIFVTGFSYTASKCNRRLIEIFKLKIKQMRIDT